ncbi:hypothetical protein [Vibrio coralliilyticus]|uniref:hypothetical protein n=1 Tax=Vibrio coralliilyticus TaxID=190893 RepID=UPI0006CCC01C|nr:hypothetical protein [Vibrio coralliilyticus]AXN34601.1 hypothetical protein DVV14_25215 [Vibrio coralliilyticus]KPH25199.1 hypothetical protein ADU60_17135 [Vibrio coralliilyticus]
MTWIVANTLFAGYAVLISDVQVTWADVNGKRTEDCLRKVYAIAPNIACGFSGSVEIGFNLLADMHAFANALRESGEALIPRDFAYKWHRRGRNIFSSYSDAKKKLGCSLIMATFSPYEFSGSAKRPRTDIITFRHSNGFEPNIRPLGRSTSIGSGSAVDRYLSSLNEMNTPQNRVAIENSDRFYMRGGMTIALILSTMLKDNPHPGISHKVHCTIVNANGVNSFPLDYEQTNGDSVNEVKMPKVAESYSAFKAYEKKFINGGSSAIA